MKRSSALAAAVLALGVCLGCLEVAAQGATGSLSGRLTDLYSRAQAGVLIVLRNEATGAEFRSTTGRNGVFSADHLPAGAYTLEAESPQAGRGRLTGILVQPGQQARLQAAMAFGPVTARPVVPAELGTVATEPTNFAPPTPINLLPPQTPQQPPRPIFSTQSVPGPATEPAGVEAGLGSRSAGSALPGQALPGQSGPGQGTARSTSAASPGLATAQRTSTTQAPTVVQAAQASPTNPAKNLRLAQQAHTLAQADELTPVAAVATSTLTGEQLQQLPASGRRWEEFTLDATGAAASPAAGRAQMRGPGEAEANTTVDGVSTRLAFGGNSSQGPAASGQTEGEPEGMGTAFANGRGYTVSEAAIRTLETSAGHTEASASRSAGGRTQLTTLGGTNGLHGQGFYYDRENVWGAKNPFTTWIKETTAGTSSTLPVFTAEPYTPPDHESTWGFGVGRQLKRDHLFWFAAMDSAHRNDPGVATVKHPYLLQTPSGCGTTSGCTPTTVGFFAQPTNDRMQLLGAQVGSGALAIPEYSKILETLTGLLGPAPRSSAQWVGFGRVDWNPGERYRATIEGTVADWNAPGGGLTRVSEAYGSHSFGTSEATEDWILGRFEAFVTPNLLAVTQGSWGRSILSAHAETPSAYEQTLNITSWGQLPQIVVDSSYGFTIGNPARFGPGSYPDEKSFHVEETVSWAHGNLLVKGGGQFDHNFDQTGKILNQTGTYHYATVENFATDALAFAALGISGALSPYNQHNCDQTGKAWRDSAGGLRGLGYLPCYSSYTQDMGPTGWHASTNQTAGWATAQWQPVKFAMLSAGMRWEMEQLPAAIAAVDNPALPFTEKTPALGSNWGPRLSLAVGREQGRWPVFRLGYGMYYSQMSNSTLLTVLSHTGSTAGDMNFYLRPTDNLHAGGAPPFPYVFSGEPLSIVKPGAVEFASVFRDPEVHQALASVEQKLPGRVEVSASAMVSLGRHLPVTVDTNLDPAVNPGTITYAVVDTSGTGPIKASRLTVPFYASWPSPTGFVGRANGGYQQIVEMTSRANSTYEAATVRLSRESTRGLALHAHYTYAHAMDWNPNETLRLTGGSVLDPDKFGLEYGTSNLDVRHAAMLIALYETPWKMRGLAGWLANGWGLSGVGHFRSGLPYTMQTGGSLAKEFTASGAAIVGLGAGINGSGGDNRVYGTGSDGLSYNLGRNTFRYPATWKADVRLAKRFNFGSMRELQVLVESFNLFNHQNVNQVETTGYTIESGTTTGGLPSLNFMNGVKANTTAFGQPLNVDSTNFYRERQVEFGLRMRF